MEVFGAVISRPIPTVSGGGGGTGVDTQLPYCAPFSASLRGATVGIQQKASVSGKSSRVYRISNSVFSDKSHVDYYNSSRRKIRCRALEEKEMVKGKKDMIKKELKRIEALTKGLTMHSRMDSYCYNLSIDPVKDGMISEVAEYLQGQLEQLRLEEKKLKQNLKEEKRKLKKADKMQKIQSLEESSTSSSSSSESSDSDCGPIGLMTLSNPKPQGIATIQIPNNQIITFPSTTTFMPRVEETSTPPDNSIDVTSTAMVVENTMPITKKIEVCMGGKCKKSGSALVMEKLQGLVDEEAVVCGCKCMGKCRDGPNVRVTENMDMNIGVSSPNHLLHIGVGLEDVDLIVENLLGRRRRRTSQEKLELAGASC